MRPSSKARGGRNLTGFNRRATRLGGMQQPSTPEVILARVLTIRLQPDEGFSLSIDVKAPGEPLSLKRIPLNFRYDETFGKLPDAYETLILDVLIGDQTLFVHANEVEASWRHFDPLLSGRIEVRPYAAGTWGPPEANNLMHPGNYS